MSPSSTREKWRFVDEVALSDPRPIPDSWAELGRVEPVEPDETVVYAVAVIPGTLLRVEVAETGEVVRGPLGERQVLRVLEVTPCGKRAVERDYRPVRGDTGWTPMRSEFAASRGVDPRELQTVDEPRLVDRYRDILGRLFGIDTVDAEGIVE